MICYVTAFNNFKCNTYDKITLDKLPYQTLKVNELNIEIGLTFLIYDSQALLNLINN